LIILGFLLLIAFAWWELRQTEPLLPFKLFANRNYVLMIVAGAVFSFGILGLFLPLTIFLQSVLGLTPLQAGLTIAPMSLVAIFVAPVAGRFTDRYGGKYILTMGFVLLALGLALVARASDLTASASSFLVPMLVAGVGMGAVAAPLATVAMRTVPRELSGAASGLLNTTRQLGSVLGSAIVGAVLQNQLAQTLHEQAAALAPQLPQQARQPFIDIFSTMAQSGLELGPRQLTQAAIPPGVPPEVAQQLQQLGRIVFTTSFAEIMPGTLLVPITVLTFAALSCLAVQRVRAVGVEKPTEAVVTAA
jgi:MFS family permease